MTKREMECHFCGRPADPHRTAEIGVDPEDPEQTVVIGWCSEACEDNDSEILETCERCDREYWATIDGLDLRDPRAYNFVLHPDTGKVWCIACAGIRRRDLAWGDLPGGWELLVD